MKETTDSHHVLCPEFGLLQVDKNGTGKIGAAEAALFLKKSGLKETLLHKIWELSDPLGNGFLDKQVRHAGDGTGGWGEAIVRYHPRKKIHIIRVVFQEQVMYMHTSFRSAKSGKIFFKKRVCFCHFYKFGKGHDGKFKEKNMHK